MGKAAREARWTGVESPAGSVPSRRNEASSVSPCHTHPAFGRLPQRSWRRDCAAIAAPEIRPRFWRL